MLGLPGICHRMCVHPHAFRVGVCVSVQSVHPAFLLLRALHASRVQYSRFACCVHSGQCRRAPPAAGVSPLRRVFYEVEGVTLGQVVLHPRTASPLGSSTAVQPLGGEPLPLKPSKGRGKGSATGGTAGSTIGTAGGTVTAVSRDAAHRAAVQAAVQGKGHNASGCDVWMARAVHALQAVQPTAAVQAVQERRHGGSFCYVMGFVLDTPQDAACLLMCVCLLALFFYFWGSRLHRSSLLGCGFWLSDKLLHSGLLLLAAMYQTCATWLHQKSLIAIQLNPHNGLNLLVVDGGAHTRPISNQPTNQPTN